VRKLLLNDIAFNVADVVDMNLFQQFATLAVFNTQDWQNFKQNVDNQQSQQPQQEIINSHTDTQSYNQYNDHADSYGTHDDDNPHNDYSEATSPHYDYTQPHDDDPQRHYDQGTGDHTDIPHEDAITYTDNSYCDGNHFDTHTDVSGHNDGTAHYDRALHDDYPAEISHTDDSTHTDDTPYNQYNDHTDTQNHDDYGFNHDNFVPSQPQIYNADTRLQGTVKIGIYSYDKNNSGYGTQDIYSKEVYYDLYIRKTNNLDGTPVWQDWQPLLLNQLENSDKGVTFTLDTTKYPDGFYQIRAVPRNVLSNGVVQNGNEQIKTVLIQQNVSPTLIVQNGNEFINFIFGYDGGLSPNNIYKEYGSLYPDAPSNMQDGIFVRFTMYDPDNPNWQKGVAYITQSNGVPLSPVDIIWDNGSTITSSDGITKTGYAFISKSLYPGIDLKGAKITLKVGDYLDPNCTQPAGQAVVQSTVSATDQTPLIVNIDVTKPTVSTDNQNYNWTNQDIKINMNYSDSLSGIQIKDFAITNTTDNPQSGWQDYTGTITINSDGIYYLHYHAVDRVKNEIYGYFGPYKLDKTPPIIINEGYTTDKYGNATVKIKATDNLSGINKIILPDGTSTTNTEFVYPILQTGTYTFTAIDNAGNATTLTVNYQKDTTTMQGTPSIRIVQ
jgi:hypothetical protein